MMPPKHVIEPRLRGCAHNRSATTWIGVCAASARLSALPQAAHGNELGTLLAANYCLLPTHKPSSLCWKPAFHSPVFVVPHNQHSLLVIIFTNTKPSIKRCQKAVLLDSLVQCICCSTEGFLCSPIVSVILREPKKTVLLFAYINKW